MSPFLKIALKISLLISAITGFFITKKYTHLKDDSIIEEYIEEEIKEEIGLDVDLTPESPEK